MDRSESAVLISKNDIPSVLDLQQKCLLHDEVTPNQELLVALQLRRMLMFNEAERGGHRSAID